MNRPKLYDRTEVLEKATELFWEKGYEATGMAEMEARTGIKKATIYNEFGDKNKLFLDCIDHFQSNHCQVVGILSKKPLGLTNIRAFYEYKISTHHSDTVQNGCFIFNTVVEKETISEEATLKIDEFLLKMKTLFKNCLTAAQKKKEINENKDCDALADYLCNFTYGFVNLGMKQMSEKELKKSVAITMGTLTS